MSVLKLFLFVDVIHDDFISLGASSSPLKNLNKTPGKSTTTPGKGILKTPKEKTGFPNVSKSGKKTNKTPGRTPGKMQEDRYALNCGRYGRVKHIKNIHRPANYCQ